MRVEPKDRARDAVCAGPFRRCLAAAVCLMLIPASGATYASGLPSGTDTLAGIEKRKGPSPRHLAPWGQPQPTGAFMHAHVAFTTDCLPVYGNSLLLGETIGRLNGGDITAVEIYTQDAGWVIGSSAELFGGFVRLSGLVEIPDENSPLEGEPFLALILADPLTSGSVDVWRQYDLTGEKAGTALPGQEVMAREDACGYSAEITLPDGLVGFVALERLARLNDEGDE